MMNRRQALLHTLGTAGLISFLPGLAPVFAKAGQSDSSDFQHSVCRWCYQSIPLEVFCEGVQDLGLPSIELTEPKDWPLLRKYGLTCALATDFSFASISDGFNDPQNHQKLQASYFALINQASEYGIPQVIVFSGNRRGLNDAQGLENCAQGLDKVVKYAEKRQITLTMELLNSKVDHPDYQCDGTGWGVQLVDKIGSPHFKLLYDIYHMQIMEGNIIATIKKYKDYISHYHTGGVPGRHEINDSQELNYPAIIQAIRDTGFKGYVAQEFIPTYPDKLAALKEGVEICSE